MTRPVFLVVGLLLIVASCTNADPGGGAQSGQSENVYFLRERSNDGPDMLALFEGKLGMIQECLQIQAENGKTDYYHVIWPFEFDFNVQGESVEILNGNDQVVAQVGDQIRVSGGELPNMTREAFEQNYLGNFKCSGPYWLANSDVAVITP